MKSNAACAYTSCGGCHASVACRSISRIVARRNLSAYEPEWSGAGNRAPIWFSTTLSAPMRRANAPAISGVLCPRSSVFLNTLASDRFRPVRPCGSIDDGIYESVASCTSSETVGGAAAGTFVSITMSVGCEDSTSGDSMSGTIAEGS